MRAPRPRRGARAGGDADGVGRRSGAPRVGTSALPCRAARSRSAAACEHVFVCGGRTSSSRPNGSTPSPATASRPSVRTFDAPEALDTRFYEVRAKSALNRVPKASRMPFRWTVNPYRGCTPCVRLLLRPPHPHLPRPRRRPRLREGDRGQGQRARGAAGELARPSWKREHVALGTNTDPYQWVEGRYRLMPEIWRALARLGHARVGADQVAAAAARRRGDEAGAADQRQPVDPHAGREGRGGPPSRTPRTRASGWRRWPSSTARASPPGS